MDFEIEQYFDFQIEYQAIVDNKNKIPDNQGHPFQRKILEINQEQMYISKNY